MVPAWKSLFSGNSAKGRIVMSVMENIAVIARVLRSFTHTLCAQCFWNHE